MASLFENLKKIRLRKEKVSPVGPFLSVAAQKLKSSGSSGSGNRNKVSI
jgi:hypothetical protein